MIIMNNKFKKWVNATSVRTIKTMAEMALSLIGTNALGITDVDWVGVLSGCALAGIITIFTCIKGLPELKVN